MAEHLPTHWPLQWPPNVPRWRAAERKRWPAIVTWTDAMPALTRELQMLVPAWFVISTDLELKKNGYPARGWETALDPGVAVWFRRMGTVHCIAADRYTTIPGNLRAVACIIDAMRGLERWGAPKVVDAALHGFAALAPPVRPWWVVLLCQPDADEAEIVTAFRRRMLAVHPDKGGTTELMQEVMRARDEALKVLKEPR